MSTPKSNSSSPRTVVKIDTSMSSHSSLDDHPKLTVMQKCMMICSPTSSRAITPRSRSPMSASSQAITSKTHTPAPSQVNSPRALSPLPSEPSEDLEYTPRIEPSEKYTVSTLQEARLGHANREEGEIIAYASTSTREIGESSTNIMMGDDHFEVAMKQSSKSTAGSSTHDTSLGEIKEEKLIDTILDGFEIFDPQERLDMQKDLSTQVESPVLHAVEKVAQGAKANFKKLQRLIREKDQLILALRNEVESAYKATIMQQEHDQEDLKRIHNVLNSREDDTVEMMESSLKRLETENGLSGQVARLFDEYLHELSAQQEKKQNEIVEANVAIWRSRCQELETHLEKEKQHWERKYHELEDTLERDKQHFKEEHQSLSHVSARLTESVINWEKAKAESEISSALVASLKEQLYAKDDELRVYGESMESLSRMLEEEKARESSLAGEYERITVDTKQTIGKVGTVTQQLKLLKQDTSMYHLQGRASEAEVKTLQTKVKDQNAMIHKLAVQLAAQRKKSTKALGKGSECRDCERLTVVRNQEQQLLRNCVTALVAQVLELKSQKQQQQRPMGAEKRGEAPSGRSGGRRDLTDSMDARSLDTKRRSDAREEKKCQHEFIPFDDDDNGSAKQCDHDFVEVDDGNGDARSGPQCPHQFVAAEDVSDLCLHEFDSVVSDKGNAPCDRECAHEFVPTKEPPKWLPESFRDTVRKGRSLDEKGAKDFDRSSAEDFSSADAIGLASTDSPRTLVEKALKLVEVETIKKLEGHKRISQKVELLQKKLQTCKRALKSNIMDISRSQTSAENSKFELLKAKATIRELEAKLQKKEESRKKMPTDCMRIKGLLENIETLEMESTLLKHEVMVEKNRQIARLERDLKRARSLEKLEGSSPRSEKCRRHPDSKKTDPSGDWNQEKADLESTIVSRDSQILELKFDVDQATWKLGQVEKRFHILFGELNCKKIELEPPIADAVLNDLFSDKKLHPPVLNLLKEKLLPSRGYSRSGSREKELENLVEALMKVMEKVGNDNENLQKSCEDTIKHLEKNKELRKTVEDLQNQLAKGGQASTQVQLLNSAGNVIADLKSQISYLADANIGLLRSLKDTEDQCSGLKEMMHRQFLEGKPHMSEQDREKFMTSKRICFSEAEHREQDKRLKEQTYKLSELEQVVATKDQFIKNLKKQLEGKDDELDLVYGKLSMKLLDETTEDIQQRKTDMWSFPEADRRYLDNRKQAPEDYFDTEYLVEHDQELLQEENRRLRKFVATLQNPDLVEEILAIKSEHERVIKICDRYEELLQIYSRQIGVPFSPLRR